MIVPQSKNQQNGNGRLRVKEHKNDIDSNGVSKYGSYESKRGSKFKDQGREYWEQQRIGQKNHNQNISDTSKTDLPTFGILTKIKSINNGNQEYNQGEYDSENQVSYSSTREDELDGLDLLKDPKENSNPNINPNGYPFGSKASSFHTKSAIEHTFITILIYVIACM